MTEITDIRKLDSDPNKQSGYQYMSNAKVGVKVEVKVMLSRRTLLFKVGTSGWIAPQYLGMLLLPGIHYLYKEGEYVGYVDIHDQQNSTSCLALKQGWIF